MKNKKIEVRMFSKNEFLHKYFIIHDFYLSVTYLKIFNRASHLMINKMITNYLFILKVYKIFIKFYFSLLKNSEHFFIVIILFYFMNIYIYIYIYIYMHMINRYMYKHKKVDNERLFQISICCPNISLTATKSQFCCIVREFKIWNLDNNGTFY